MPDISEDRIIRQFEDFIYSQGIRPHGTLSINPDGKIHRFTLEGDRLGTKNGAYCLHVDGCPSGWVQDWHKNGEKLLWKYSYSDSEKREYAQQQQDSATREKLERERKENERRKAEAEKLHRENEAQALHQAWNMYISALRANYQKQRQAVLSHGYINSRFADNGINFTAQELACFDVVYDTHQKFFHVMPVTLLHEDFYYGVSYKKGSLLVPMRNVATNAFQSLIVIPPKHDAKGHYDKYYIKHLPTKGTAHYLIPDLTAKPQGILICEGFCTALAVIKLTAGVMPVFSAGSCNNLLPVCEGLRKRYTYKRIIIMADNDEAGISKAQECVNAGVADNYKIPPIEGEDFYDYLVRTTRKGNNDNE